MDHERDWEQCGVQKTKVSGHDLVRRGYKFYLLVLFFVPHYYTSFGKLLKSCSPCMMALCPLFSKISIGLAMLRSSSKSGSRWSMSVPSLLQNSKYGSNPYHDEPSCEKLPNTPSRKRMETRKQKLPFLWERSLWGLAYSKLKASVNLAMACESSVSPIYYALVRSAGI